jgi:hypothetical protein
VIAQAMTLAAAASKDPESARSVAPLP